MKLLRKMTAFLLVFGLLSGTVAAMSAAVYPDDADGSSAAVGAASAEYQPRLSAPSYSNPYYYSDRNIYYACGWGMPNCTCYAWGRAYEILGQEPNLCLYDAHLWYDYNIENGYYPYGSEPKLGAVACWAYTSGVSGHVAVVEKITDQTVTFSNSAYSGTEFYTDTVPIDDPSDGRKTWIFQGYIYIGDFAAPEDDDDDLRDQADEPEGELYRITSDDGVNLRSAAGTGSRIVGWLLYDEIASVTRTATADGYTWGYTAHNGMNGWFALDFAEPVKSDPQPTEPQPTEPQPTELQPDETLPVPTVTSSQGELLMGDVDSDGRITILDATRIQRILARLVEPNAYMLAVSDFNGDGRLSILDANRIQRYLVNIP